MNTTTHHNLKILADESLPLLTELFPKPFTLTRYQTSAQIPNLLPTHEILLCRSTLHVNASLLKNSTIQCVATASSGIDHIDEAYLAQHHITLFDAKGSNARAVADYVVATLAALHRLDQPVGTVAGVIGVGEVGSRVVKRLQAAGFHVMCYDPFKYSHGALADLAACDLICLHPNLHESQPFPSKHLLNADFLNQLKPGVVIINASRGGIVDEDALLASGKPIVYCTDVYQNEPSVNSRIIDFATLCTPHIAGHSIEAKQNAIIQLSQKIHQHYGLMSPSFELPMAIPQAARSHHWQDLVLSFYNPADDTKQIKTAIDKKAAFLTQRQSHQYRHDFNRYIPSMMSQQSHSLLGIQTK